MSAKTSFFRQLARAGKYTLGSLFSRWHRLAIFFPLSGGWRVWTHGRVIPVAHLHWDVLEYYRHFVPERDGLIMDVGGELGVETKQFSELAGSEGRVVVCECMPDHAERLRDIARERSNVTVVECACWDEEGEIDFFAGHTPGSNTAVVEARGQRGQILAKDASKPLRVKARTLDAVWREVAGGKPVDFLKMDIEGAEYEALAGAAEMLRATRRAVIAAYHIRDGIPTAARVGEMLRALGFSVRIDENLHVYAQRNSKS